MAVMSREAIAPCADPYCVDFRQSKCDGRSPACHLSAAVPQPAQSAAQTIRYLRNRPRYTLVPPGSKPFMEARDHGADSLENGYGTQEPTWCKPFQLRARKIFPFIKKCGS